MDVAAADQLISSQLTSNWLYTPRPDKQFQITERARALLDADGNGKISKAELRAGLLQDTVSFDPKLKQILANRSRIPLDPAILPKDKSPRWDTVEQCMEFVMRYFKEDRAKANLADPSFDADFGPQHNIAKDVRALAKGELKKPGYTAYVNGEITPPRAGDILIAEGKSTYHVALVTAMTHNGKGWTLTVFQANVPYDTNSPNMEDHVEKIPLTYRDGKWSVPPLATAQKGYDEDMDVVGWVHPDDSKALPEARATQKLR